MAKLQERADSFMWAIVALAIVAVIFAKSSYSAQFVTGVSDMLTRLINSVMRSAT